MLHLNNTIFILLWYTHLITRTPLIRICLNIRLPALTDIPKTNLQRFLQIISTLNVLLKCSGFVLHYRFFKAHEVDVLVS